MDKIDKKLITLLQQNARMPLKALAEKVFLSSPAVSARIERLEKEEIIEGYEVKINQLKLGYHITAFINLEVAPVQKPEFYPFIKSCPNVVECNCVTGTYSMLLKVVFPSDGAGYVYRTASEVRQNQYTDSLLDTGCTKRN